MRPNQSARHKSVDLDGPVTEVLTLVVERLEELKPGLLARSLATGRLTGALPFGPRPAAALRREAGPFGAEQVQAAPAAKAAPALRGRAPEEALSPAEALIRDTAQAAFAEAASLRDFVERLEARGIQCRPGVRLEEQAFHGFRFTTLEASVTGGRVDLTGRGFSEGRLAYDHARDLGWVMEAQAEHDRRFGPISELLDRLRGGGRPALQSEADSASCP